MPMKKKPGKRLTRKPRRPKGFKLNSRSRMFFDRGMLDGLSGKKPGSRGKNYREGYKNGRNLFLAVDKFTKLKRIAERFTKERLKRIALGET